MKKIINNKLYDTSKAIYLTSYIEQSQNQTVHMYKTKNGAYFIVTTTGKEKELQLVTEEQVKKCLQCEDVEKYIELFGIIEG